MRFKVTLFTRCSRSAPWIEEYYASDALFVRKKKKAALKKKAPERSSLIVECLFIREGFKPTPIHHLQKIRFLQLVFPPFVCVLQEKGGFTERKGKAARSWKPDGGDPARAGFQQNIN